MSRERFNERLAYIAKRLHKKAKSEELINLEGLLSLIVDVEYRRRYSQNTKINASIEEQL
jgi:hypothetical protein